MDYLDVTDVQRRVALAALKTVALADEELEVHEAQLLEAAAKALQVEIDVEELKPVTAEEVATLFPSPALRLRLVQAQLIMAMMDGEVRKDELECIRSFCEVLGVEEPRLKNLRQYLEGHMRLIQWDLLRRSQMIDDVFGEARRREGLRGVWKTFGAMQGLSEDASVAWKYRRLGLLPEGTFGRMYWEHMSARQFSFPGEHKAFPELLAKHDLCHVLGEYDTDAAGECEVIAFICGFMKADPFWYLFAIIMHMHLGVEIFVGDPTARLAMDHEKVIQALKRGLLVSEDLYDTGWDYWPLFALPIEEVRARYNIVPKDTVV